jgi:hypothetical protein
MSNELITDIEETIKREKLEEFWSENRAYIIACALLAILLTGIMSGYRHYNEKAGTVSTRAYLTALKQEDKAAALIKTAPQLMPSQRAVALLTAGGLLADKGDLGGALKQYRALAAEKAAPETYRQLGTLMSVRIAWGQSKDKAKEADTYMALLQPLWSDKSSPWQFHAHFEAAQILASGKQDYAGARKHLTDLVDNADIPPSLRERARALDHVYELKAPSAPAAATKQGETN